MNDLTGYVCIAQPQNAGRIINILLGNNGTLTYQGRPHHQQRHAERQLANLRPEDFVYARLAYLRCHVQQRGETDERFAHERRLVIIVENDPGLMMFGPMTREGHLWFDWCAPLETNQLQPFINRNRNDWRNITYIQREVGRQSHRFPHLATFQLEYL